MSRNSSAPNASITCSGPALAFLMMDAVIISETSVNFYETTQSNIPEDIFTHPHRLWKLLSFQPNGYQDQVLQCKSWSLISCWVCLTFLVRLQGMELGHRGNFTKALHMQLFQKDNWPLD
jgi:hypothetical protein